MEFEEKTFVLKNGQQALLQRLQPADAEKMLEFLRETSRESDFLLRYPEENIMGISEEVQFLEGICQSDNKIMLACVIDGSVAGNLSLRGNDYRKLRHRAELALAVRKNYWHLGIGRAMLTEAIGLARNLGLKYLELDYIDGNARAKGLYESLGFQEIARIPQAYCQPDGTFADAILMRKCL